MFFSKSKSISFLKNSFFKTDVYFLIHLEGATLYGVLLDHLFPSSPIFLLDNCRAWKRLVLIYVPCKMAVYSN